MGGELGVSTGAGGYADGAPDRADADVGGAGAAPAYGDGFYGPGESGGAAFQSGTAVGCAGGANLYFTAGEPVGTIGQKGGGSVRRKGRFFLQAVAVVGGFIQTISALLRQGTAGGVFYSLRRERIRKTFSWRALQRIGY